ncbi:MAG: response regulator transcription factor [Synergistaceae bacterium]|nr:response regulator transcription factor [Synergistaceae bacterium]
MKKINIILADGSRLFANALKTILSEEQDFNVVSDVYCGIEAIRNVQVLRPDILVLGQVLPDITMFQVVREIYRDIKSIRFLFIVKDGNSELLKFLSEVQTIGVIRHNTDVSELIVALRSIAKGERYISKDVLNDLRYVPEEPDGKDLLREITPREREVLYWLSQGQNNREIAATMILSEKTIKNHITHLLKKLKVADRTKAAAIAWAEGLPLIPEEFFFPSGGR